MRIEEDRLRLLLEHSGPPHRDGFVRDARMQVMADQTLPSLGRVLQNGSFLGFMVEGARIPRPSPLGRRRSSCSLRSPDDSSHSSCR